MNVLCPHLDIWCQALIQIGVENSRRLVQSLGNFHHNDRHDFLEKTCCKYNRLCNRILFTRFLSRRQDTPVGICAHTHEMYVFSICREESKQTKNVKLITSKECCSTCFRCILCLVLIWNGNNKTSPSKSVYIF